MGKKGILLNKFHCKKVERRLVAPTALYGNELWISKEHKGGREKLKERDNEITGDIKR
jgi:hypothetical protein